MAEVSPPQHDIPSGFPKGPIWEDVGREGSETIAADVALWERMIAIRSHEVAVERLNAKGLIRGSTHLYIGMEAGAVGVVGSLTADDVVIGYYRGHGHALATGVPVGSLLAEILGRTNGTSQGHAGTKHVMDVSRRYLGSYAIVGQQVPLAVGAALALKKGAEAGQCPQGVVVCFMGDGAMNQGATMEAFALATGLGLRVLFVCEDIKYAVSTSSAKVSGTDGWVARARGFGIDGAKVDGQDVRTVLAAATAARRNIIDRGGPGFLELDTYRYRGHSVFQTDQRYRVPGELEAWLARDPIAIQQERLLTRGLGEPELNHRVDRIEQAIAGAVAWAEAGEPAPAVTADAMYARSLPRRLVEWSR